MTTKDSNTHNPTPADQPLALRLSEGLGPNARKLASQLQNAAYNCGYEDAHPSNATTRQAKADTKCRDVLAALYAECDRLAAAEAKTNSYIVDNARLAEQVENLRAALQWYADGLHFDKASPDAWDTVVTGEPAYWEWRHLSTHPDTVDFGKWSEWKRVEARSAIHTIEDALAEFRAYIAQGYKYELRALYTPSDA